MHTRDNKIGNEGGNALVEALKENTTLKDINVKGDSKKPFNSRTFKLHRQSNKR